MTVSTQLLALVAVSGLALAGYAGAASQGLLPEGMDMGLGATKRCERAANVSAEVAERCATLLERGRGAAKRCERADDSAQGLQERCAEMRDHAKQGRRGPGDKPGLQAPPFRVENGTVEGKWVSFTVDGATATITGYTSHGPFADAVLFDSIASSLNGEDGMRVRGPLWVGHEGRLVAAAFNAPNAFLAAKNYADEVVTLTFDVGDGIALEQGERGVVLSHDNNKALLAPRGNATLSLSGDVVTATLGKGDAVVFAIEGYPRLLEHEVQVLRHIARAWEQRGGEPAAEGPDEAAVAATLDVGA